MSDSKTWTVIYEGTVREVYTVSASSSEEALDKWPDQEPDSSEVIDGCVTDVMETPEEDSHEQDD